MKTEEYISKFPSIKETQVLTEEMMTEIEAGHSCQGNSCRFGCLPTCKPRCFADNKKGSKE